MPSYWKAMFCVLFRGDMVRGASNGLHVYVGVFLMVCVGRSRRVPSVPGVAECCNCGGWRPFRGPVPLTELMCETVSRIVTLGWGRRAARLERILSLEKTKRWCMNESM